MGVITFNGVSSKTLGIEVWTPPDYETAERIYEIITVPGRNGDLVMDTGAYKNVNRSYSISIGQEGGNFALLSNKIVEWLHSGNGYLRLEDSYEPDVFKLARYNGEVNIGNVLQQAGKTNLTFDRKPQRFLKSGEAPVTINNTNGKMKNPTKFSSKPLIRINGNGTGVVHIGDYSITVSNLSAYMYVDCDIEVAYKGAINMNNFVTLNKGFPVMVPGDNSILYSGGITSVQITPRWWKL